MASKPKGQSWFDIQMAIMTISMALVMVFWNLFAGPDRETSLRKATEAQADQPEPTVESRVIAAIVPTPSMSPPGEKIMLGGAAPQTVITIQKPRGGGGGGNVTSTRSS